MHLVLTRTMLGSRLLAVAEDRNAAMLMGIRPDRMQALAWGVGAASTGVAGALIALFFYISPTVGESLTLIAFVVVCLGGFGSVPGALIAGLAIGVIEALSAYLIGAVYQDVVVYALFLVVLWVRPQGLLGTRRGMSRIVMRHDPSIGSRRRCSIAAWPLLVQDVFLQRVGALVLLAAISASAWNLLGGYAGQVSVGHARVFRRRRLCSPGGLYRTGAGRRSPARRSASLVSAVLAVVVGTPTFRLRGHYFSMATIAAAELARILAANWPLVGAAVGLMGPPRPRTIADLSFISPVPYHYLFLAVLLVLLGADLRRCSAAAWATTWPPSAAATARRAASACRCCATSCTRCCCRRAFTSIAGSLYAVMVGFVDPDSVLGILVSVKMIIIAALGGAGTLFGPLVGAVILVPLEETTNALFGGGGTGITFIIYGAIIVFVARFQPGGMAALWRASRRQRAAGGRAVRR